jgi:two-component system NtrC family sensor kinase
MSEQKILELFLGNAEKIDTIFIRDRIRPILEMGNDGILILDEKGRIEFANTTAIAITGYPLEKLLGKRCSIFLNGLQYKKLKEIIQDEKVDGDFCCRFDAEIICSKGKSHPSEVDIARTRYSDGKEHIYIFLRSILQRERFEYALREANTFFTNIIQHSVDGIIGADMKGNVMIFNEGAENMLDYKSDEVIGKIHIIELYPPGIAKEMMRRLRSDGHGGRGKLQSSQTILIDKEGNEIPVNISAAIIYDDDGNEKASVGIFTDLRPRLKMQKELDETHLQLLQSEKMASIGKLAAGVAHEINNPLAGILMYAMMIKEELQEDHPTRDDLNKIIEQAMRCKEIVKELLEFARQSPPAKERIDINTSLSRTISLLENQALFHNIEIIKEFDPSLPLSDGDVGRLNQVFTNIILNAAEAMDGQGTLTITSDYKRDENMVEVRISDTGCGIPEEDFSHLFEPFFTTKGVGRGTGLGLSTSYGIIKKHGGEINVESKVGKGSTFIILLPVPEQGREAKSDSEDSTHNIQTYDSASLK